MTDVTTQKNGIDVYNKTTYASQWLNAADERIASGYYEKDHYRDTLETLKNAPGNRVLECGIGTGEFFALELAKSGKSVYGIDFSDELLKDCAYRFGREGLAARLGMADVHALPFKEASFDIVFAIGVTPFMKDLALGVEEMVRVTKKGGIVVFDLMNIWHTSQFINHWYRVFESSRFGFAFIRGLKTLKKNMGFQTHFKAAPEEVNHKLYSPLSLRRAMKKLGIGYRVRGYNVLLPLDLPIFGRYGNLCERSKSLSYGLKDNKFLKYLGSKLVVIIEK